MISLDAEKNLENVTVLHYKGLGCNRDTRNITNHNKHNIHQANSQHQTKWRETQNNLTEIRNKTVFSTLSLYIQYST